jgi:hypothetical protein
MNKFERNAYKEMIKISIWSVNDKSGLSVAASL